MSDVIERLQKAETRPLDADGKTQLWETLQDARAEIARLRLTDEEREAVNDMCEFAEDFLGDDDPNIIILRGLLERLGPTGSEESRPASTPQVAYVQALENKAFPP